MVARNDGYRRAPPTRRDRDIRRQRAKLTRQGDSRKGGRVQVKWLVARPVAAGTRAVVALPAAIVSGAIAAITAIAAVAVVATAALPAAPASATPSHPSAATLYGDAMANT